MNQINQKFLAGLGLFFGLNGTLMLIAGYWPGLSQFGVSERFFMSLAWLLATVGLLALIARALTGRQK